MEVNLRLITRSQEEFRVKSIGNRNNGISCKSIMTQTKTGAHRDSESFQGALFSENMGSNSKHLNVNK